MIVSKAVLIVGHGSRLVFNKMTMEAHADALRAAGVENVYIGFNETSFPSIEDAMSDMVADGMDEVVALPFFIASGLHMTRDIPPKLGLKDGLKEDTVEIKGKKILVHFEDPFGEDPNLTDILCEKIDEVPVEGNKRGIIVMGHGSRLQYNSQIIELNAARLRQRGYGDVRVGYNEFNDPKIDEVVESMVKDGVDQIIALPLFIASGAHLSKDIPYRLGIPENTDRAERTIGGKVVKIVYTTPVGSDMRLNKVLCAKIQKYYGE